jgi:siderophore synthetase component
LNQLARKTKSDPEAPRLVAERAALERILNAYMREAGNSTVDGHAGPLPLEVIGSRSELVWLPLPHSQSLVLATVRRRSAAGLHHFGRCFWRCALRSPAGEQTWEPVTPGQLIEQILGELAEGSSTGLLQKLHGQVLNSIEKTALYLTKGKTRARADGEDSLLFGHPLHPTPKSSEGFDPSDLDLYAPELGASFQLEVIEVAPELLHEESLSGHSLPLGGQLPCHPWQARYLRSQPWVEELIGLGRLKFLGPQGPKVQPTSSVRTVRCGEHYFKLPLNVRITNYFRLNGEEHLRRSLDVCRAVVAGPSRVAQLTSTVLLENGWRTLRLPDEQAAQCGVLFRRAPTGPEPVVLAALLESGPDGGAKPHLALTMQWLRRYLDVALPAVLGWWLERGVSLEAHVQNTLVTLCQGWPTRLYLRDLEGGSLWNEHPASTWREVGIDPSSPALYTEGHAWQRLLYYFFVNQLGHLVATLALACDQSEEPLWREVNAAIRRLPEMGPRELWLKYRAKLLETAHLPAKANLTSRLHERSENPLYVAISNPFVDNCHARH